MQLHFDKMEGCGNDFVVLDRLAWPEQPLPEASLVRHLSDRRRGIGCDQLLVLERAGVAGEPGAAFRIYNADGSRAEQCGNGARCIAALLHERHDYPEDFLFQSPAGAIRGRVRDGRVAVSMGVPEFSAQAIPIRAEQSADCRYQLEVCGETVTLGAVSMGNPHAVLVVEDADSAPVEQLGAALQQHHAFPTGVNVGFLQILSGHRGRLRVVERGVGETPACGSGACAAAVVGKRAGLFDGDPIHLDLRGGELVISWPAEGHQVWLEGAARWVFKGQLTL